MPNSPLDIERASHLRFLTLGFHTASANSGYLVASARPLTLALDSDPLIQLVGAIGFQLRGHICFQNFSLHLKARIIAD